MNSVEIYDRFNESSATVVVDHIVDSFIVYDFINET